MKLCPCGSGEYRRELKDSAEIFCTFVCDKCENKKRKSFNSSIFKPGRYSVTGREEDIGNEEPMDNLKDVIGRIDWKELAEQKRVLAGMGDPERQGTIDGLLNFIDHIQDAAELDGYPVVFLTSEEDEA